KTTHAPPPQSCSSNLNLHPLTRCDYPVDNRSRNLALHAQCVLKHSDSANSAEITATCTHLRLNIIDLSTQSIVRAVPTPSYSRNKTVTPKELARDIQHAFSRR